MLYRVRWLLRIFSTQDRQGGPAQNHIHHTMGVFCIQGDAIWPHKCSNDLSTFFNLYIFPIPWEVYQILYR